MLRTPRSLYTRLIQGTFVAQFRKPTLDSSTSQSHFPLPAFVVHKHFGLTNSERLSTHTYTYTYARLKTFPRSRERSAPIRSEKQTEGTPRIHRNCRLLLDG